MTGGRRGSKHLLLANAADRKQQQHNSSPSPPMGVRGRAVHPPDKQTNNPGSNAELSLYNTDPEQQRNVFWAAPPSEQEQLLKKLPSDAWQTTTTGTFEQTTQAVGDIANTDSGEPAAKNRKVCFGNFAHYMREGDFCLPKWNFIKCVLIWSQ